MAFRVELPGLYFDDVVADATPTRPTLVNRNPEPNEVEVSAGTNIALEIVDVWLTTPFDGGRHERRINQIDNPPRV